MRSYGRLRSENVDGLTVHLWRLTIGRLPTWCQVVAALTVGVGAIAFVCWNMVPDVYQESVVRALSRHHQSSTLIGRLADGSPGDRGTGAGSIVVVPIAVTPDPSSRIDSVVAIADVRMALDLPAEACRLYREALLQLAPASRSRVDNGAWKRADALYADHRWTEAAHLYHSLFARSPQIKRGG